MKMRVGVIGGGAAGLCAARHLNSEPDKFDFLVFEQWNEVGGTWNYTDWVGLDNFNLPVHSSMYKNLRTNIPKEIMGFPDYPFEDGGNSFTHHTDVLRYLQNYAKHHDLYKKIKLLSHVESVEPEKMDGGNILWKVQVKDLQSNVVTSYDFDVVMVCNGHLAVPHIPDIEGIDRFEGEAMHSHSYRNPSSFKDKVVIVLGAASSGMDISMEIAPVAKKVYLSHNLPKKHSCDLPENVIQVPGIKSAHSNGFTLHDKSVVDVDVVVYCTGYQFNFPFLSENCNVRVENNRVIPLYKHLIHMDFPSLCFVGLPFRVLPFPMFHFQVVYFLKTLDGTITLPGREEMQEDADKDYFKRVIDMKMPPKDAHRMGSLQWDYFQDLGNTAHCEKLPPVCKMIYEAVESQRNNNVMWYKREQYSIINDREYERQMPDP